MSKKRSREESNGDDVSHLVAKPEEVCAVVLAKTRAWKDRCGCLYSIDSKIDVSKDHVVLKVGFFDEIKCSLILDMFSTPLPGNFVIQSASCDLNKACVCFTITKSAKVARAAAPVKPARDSSSAASCDLLRLRALYDVKEADAATVQEALAAVTCAGEGSQLAKCAHRPGLYVLYVTQPRDGVVPCEALVAAAAHDGVVDFEHKQVVISVPKRQSDIY